ncbi:MAG TPA: uroporphyrinogen-III synthase [Acidimicrobiales bacterium]|nr:uroporphyrinogen-III synthase [Acidimicrobiales bacterium]
MDKPLAGMTVGITAGRRADEQARLFQSRGAATVLGPTLSLEPAGDDTLLRAATEALVERPPDYLLASTGYGMRAWLEAAGRWGLEHALLAALGHARVANRGAKAASATRGAGLAEWWRAPAERFDEVVERVLGEPLAGARVAVQLHGSALPAAVGRLSAAGASVVEVDAYQAGMPADDGPARALVAAVLAGGVAAVTFTAAPGVHNLFAVAARTDDAGALRDAFNRSVVAGCVGPVCAEGALQEGVVEPVVPERARLVPLVDAVAARLAAGR